MVQKVSFFSVLQSPKSYEVSVLDVQEKISVFRQISDITISQSL